MKSLDLVRNYFNREAGRFDAIYEERKPWLHRVVDQTFRRVVVERFRLICNLAPSASVAWTVLDAGCGSGRYSIALARLGARRVVGVDVAPAMIDLAAREAAKAGIDTCEFHVSPFLDFESSERFDVVVATGYFDYLEDPLPHLQKMISMSSGKIFITFPKRWELRVPIRKLRFWIERGFVRFYSREEVKELVVRAGLSEERLSLIDLGRDLVAVLRVR